MQKTQIFIIFTSFDLKAYDWFDVLSKRFKCTVNLPGERKLPFLSTNGLFLQQTATNGSNNVWNGKVYLLKQTKLVFRNTQ